MKSSSCALRGGGIHRALLTLLVLAVLAPALAAPAAAQGDPSIRDWGSPPGSPPPWTTDDVWVDNDGDGVQGLGEPTVGLANRLFARVRNLATSPVEGATVTFSFAPYGVWSPASWGDFKEILAVHDVNLGAAGSATAEKVIEVSWTLDPSEDNGGAWGGHEVGEFQHFCVHVHIDFAGDANAGNNDAQNNFGNVPAVAGKIAPLNFLIANPKAQAAIAELDVRGLPRGWELEIRGAERGRFQLAAREVRLVTLTPFPGEARADGVRLDVGLVVDGVVVGGFTFEVDEVEAGNLTDFPPNGGTLSSYLVGTWDLRRRGDTVLFVVNPTAFHRRVVVAFFDADEKPLTCVREKLSPNDLLELDVRRYLKEGYGVVKIVSFHPQVERTLPGLVGHQRQLVKTFWHGLRTAAETPLHPIPAAVLKDDLAIIAKACP